MNKNEVKKALYKEKPVAKLVAKDRCVNCSYYYNTTLASGDEIGFEVPVSEMGEKVFENELPAQLLIRWMVEV